MSIYQKAFGSASFARNIDRHASSSIGLFLPNLQGGGAERMMVNLANGLAEKGEQVSLVVGSDDGPYRNEVAGDVDLVNLNSAGVLGALRPLVRYLRRERPRVLLVTLNHASIVALVAKRIARVDTCVIVREANTFTRNKALSFKSKLVQMIMRRLYPYADGIVAVSEGVADDLSRAIRVPRKRVAVLPNPVVTSDIETKAEDSADHPWLAEINSVPVVLAVGRLHYQKDYPTLLKAFASVLKVRPSRLIILGEGPLRKELDQLIARLGTDDFVSMPGFVDNPFAYMARASLFVLSSRYEGLPGTLVQAMACGCPVVSTDCPSGPREILDDGRVGSLVPVGDSDAMADAIIKSLSNPSYDAEIIKQRASFYSVEESVIRYRRLFSKVSYES